MAIRRPQPHRSEFPISKYHGRRLTEPEFLALPEEKPYLEYVDGVVCQKAMPNELHREIVFFLDYVLYGYRLKYGGAGGPEGRVRLPDGSGYRLPDTAYWAPGRDSGDDSVPSVVFEVRSPDDTPASLRRKCRSFRANGVEACFLIDPMNRTVEAFDETRDGEPVPADGAVETAAMPGFSLDLKELFGTLDR